MSGYNGIWPPHLIYAPAFFIILILALRAKVETCQPPFIFPEECWLLFKMLSVITQDKRFQFINKIDGTAYRQFLFFVSRTNSPVKSIPTILPTIISCLHEAWICPQVQACLVRFHTYPNVIIQPHQTVNVFTWAFRNVYSRGEKEED